MVPLSCRLSGHQISQSFVCHAIRSTFTFCYFVKCSPDSPREQQFVGRVSERVIGRRSQDVPLSHPYLCSLLFPLVSLCSRHGMTSLLFSFTTPSAHLSAHRTRQLLLKLRMLMLLSRVGRSCTRTFLSVTDSSSLLTLLLLSLQMQTHPRSHPIHLMGPANAAVDAEAEWRDEGRPDSGMRNMGVITVL